MKDMKTERKQEFVEYKLHLVRPCAHIALTTNRYGVYSMTHQIMTKKKQEKKTEEEEEIYGTMRSVT